MIKVLQSVRIIKEVGDCTLNDAEVIERTINAFQKIQAHMKNAKKENAMETYEGLKSDYISLKAILTSLGVNLIDIDKINE